MKHWLLGMLAAVVVLSGCAPAQMGRAAYSPLDGSGGKAAVAAGGGVWYVKGDAVGATVPSQVFQDTFSGQFGYNDLSVGMKLSNSVNWFNITGKDLPEGWSVDLAKQTATMQVMRVVIGENQTKYYSSLVTVEPIFAVNVPSNTKEGVYPLEAEITSVYDGKRKYSVELSVRVTAPAPAAN